MLNTAKRAVAIVLTLALVFTLAGCNQPVDDGSSIEYIEQVETIIVGGDGTTTTDDDEQTPGQTQTPGTSKPSKPGTSKPSKPGTSKPSGSGGGSGNSEGSPILVNPDDYRGTKIILGTTIDPKDDGTDYVISNFEKEYGIEVEIYVPSGDYAADYVALIAANKAPTVARTQGDAPIYVGYFDSLDNAKINYDHPIWNQNTFKYSTYNGKTLLCDTIGNFWTEMDVIAYSKSLLKKAGCPTPQELDKAGNWNFDSFVMLAQKTSALDECGGVAFGISDTLLHMAGGAVYRADSNNRMVNGIDSKTIAAFKKISQGYKDGYFGGDFYGILTGSTAMVVTHLWATRTDGLLSTHNNFNDLGFYFLPAVEKGGELPTTGLFRGMGVFKRCNENPETGPKAGAAGGIFLSEYLNVENYDLERSFVSEEARSFFFEACELYCNTKNFDPYYTTYSLNEGISGIDDDAEVYAHFHTDPAQIDSKMEAIKSATQKGVDNLNKYIEQNVNGN